MNLPMPTTISEVLAAVAAGVRPESRCTGAFLELCLVLIQKADFIENYDRLRGTGISKLGTRPALAAAIDKATGAEADILRQYVVDVFDLFWLRMPAECFHPTVGDSTPRKDHP